MHHVFLYCSCVQASDAICSRLGVIATMVARFRETFKAGALALPAESRPLLLHDGCRFAMVPALEIRYPLLAKLAFIVQHESIVTCREIVNERVSKPVVQLVTEGLVIRLSAELQQQNQHMLDSMMGLSRRESEMVNALCSTARE